MIRGPRTLKLGAILSLVLACGPSSPAKDTATDASPSLSAVCEHRAELTWRGSAQTKEEVQRDCEKTYASYRDEGEAARWDCRSRCTMAAQTKDDLAQCVDRCPIPKPNVDCGDVFREAEIAAALRAPLKAGNVGSLGESGSCGVTFKSENLEVMALLSFHHTIANAQAAVKANENPPTTSRRERCKEVVQQGRFMLSLSLEEGGTCDRDALRRALEQARQHLTP